MIDDVDETIFEEVREKEERIHQAKTFCLVIDNVVEIKDEDYNQLFWFLWPEISMRSRQ